MNLDKFIEELKSCFGPPFIEEGIVKVRRDASGTGLCIRIGNRDIQFDDDLKMVGRGTSIHDPRVVLSGISSVMTECPDCSRWSEHHKFEEKGRGA